MRFDIITIFPDIFDSYLSESLFKRARTNKIIDVHVHNLRDYSPDKKHHKVDDRPFGGGPGMVLQIEPIYEAVSQITRHVSRNKKTRVILFSTRGKKLDAKVARRLSKYDRLILICGRYEGVDERVARFVADEELSIGDYVLSGGELPALVLMEAVSRYKPGFLGKFASLEDERGSFPAYTRPPVFSPKRGVKWTVPKVLQSGNHAKIATWRQRK
ncbi:MAG TPA: tRNA (guanosine(37)-N1)-methyltransferase TrmD [Candidatus Paceibacterota bacterium]|nr:tRNA (guanosine(37)-N1)-methyltransferase TrmD [Candidatus Paceibacterota bacterium]